MIFDFNYTVEITKIKKDLQDIKSVRDSLADHPEKYRQLCKNTSTDFSVIKDMISLKSEYSLLISCYTFAERLLKSVVYECLDYDRHINENVNLFLKRKVNPESFSPRVFFKDFSKELQDLSKKKFLLNKNHSSIKIYDEMVTSRHRYAHANQYPFRFENYGEVIEVLEYLAWESSMFLTNEKKHEMLSIEYIEIIDMSKKLKKIEGKGLLRSQKKYKGINIKDFRDKVKRFESKYRNEFSGVRIFDSLLNNLKEVANYNLNKNTTFELSAVCQSIGKEYH